MAHGARRAMTVSASSDPPPHVLPLEEALAGGWRLSSEQDSLNQLGGATRGVVPRKRNTPLCGESLGAGAFASRCCSRALVSWWDMSPAREELPLGSQRGLTAFQLSTQAPGSLSVMSLVEMTGMVGSVCRLCDALSHARHAESGIDG